MRGKHARIDPRANSFPANDRAKAEVRRRRTITPASSPIQSAFGRLLLRVGVISKE
jgi:hypothetical protein